MKTRIASRGLMSLTAWGALALLLGPQLDGQRASRFERQTVNGQAVVAREVLIKFREPIGPADVTALAVDTDAANVSRIGRAGTLLVRSRSMTAAALVEKLARRADVAYAEPNFIIQIAAAPDDPRLEDLWGLVRIGGEPAWDLSTGSTSNVVAVIDSGIDYTHPDLAANVWTAPAAFTVTVAGAPVTCTAGTHGFNAIDRTCDPMDDHNHGTHVSGTIGAVGNNGIGVVGVNWAARIMGIKFLDSEGSGSVADAIAAVEFAMAAKQAFAATGAADIRVLSNSWAGTQFSQALLDQVNAANDANMLFVAGAGNNGFNNDVFPMYPASFDAPNVVAVAATTSGDDRAWFSNYGALSVDLGAPGEDILSTIGGNAYQFASGTSMATPHVSGAAALVLALCPMDTAGLKATLLGTVDALPSLAGVTVTGGRLNVNNALHACTAPPPIPLGLKARGTDTTITVSWTPAVGAMRYKVRRSLTSGGPYSLLADAVTGTAYADTAVVNGTRYYYVVSAANDVGESADSIEVSAVPNVPPDLVVSSVTVPATAAAGSTILLQVTTKNQGTGVAEVSTTRFYLSANSALDAADALLAGEQAVPGLAAGATASASVSVAFPAGIATGRYYLIAVADDDDVLGETSETNNRQARAVQIGPDLVIATLTVPVSGAAGGTITVTDSVRNQGGGPAALSRTRFYLSASPTMTAGVLLAEGRDVAPLAAGATSAGETTLTIPGTTTIGAYYIVAKADGHDAIVETSETNNSYARPVQVGGDLVVSALVVPAGAAAGSPITVTDTVKNQGSAQIGPSTTRFYLSSNSALDAADTALTGGRELAALDPGVSHAGSTIVVLPPATGAGGYYIIAKADADAAAAETNETNNTVARAIQIGADLVVAAIDVPAKAGPGTTIAVGDTTKNQGGGAAPPSTTRFYLSPNATLDSSDVVLGDRSIPGLAAGAVLAGSTTLMIPAGATPGAYYVIARADADNVVVEPAETNNNLARPIGIGGDLIVSLLAAPARAAAGASILVSAAITNQGGGGTVASTTRYYLSNDGTVGAGDVLLDGADAAPALAAGGSHSASTSVTIPSGQAARTVYLIARADSDNAVSETLETNNTRMRLISIGPDLTVVSLTLSSSTVISGAGLAVTDMVKNQGASESPRTTTALFLSANGQLDGADILLTSGRSVLELPSGAVSSGVVTVTVPADTPPGLYYLLAKADGADAVIEALETNNLLARVIQVVPAP